MEISQLNEDEAINILKTMCTDNFCIEQLKTKQAIETLLGLYQQEKDSNQWLLKAFDESRNNNIELSKEYCKIQQELQQEKEKNKKLQIRGKELIEEKQELNTALLYDNISKDKIRDMQRYREFELQQEYKEFENDSEWKTYNKILEEN